MLHQKGMRLKMENYTQGNVEQRQSWSLNNINGYDVGPGYFNLVYNLNKENLVTQNLTPTRINTREKMENYFKGQQNAIDLLDYVSAKAFIKLTPEQQAKIATRITQNGSNTTWETITAEEAKEMNLTTLESLWDNKIILRPNNAWGVSIRGLAPMTSQGGDDYGFESVWVTRWYITHNDAGYANALANKRNFFEMLGYGGVDGYVTYGSRESKNDLDAIQKITKSVTGTAMDWKEYKFSRYETIENNLDNKYVNVDLMIDKFTEALRNDANNNNKNITNGTNLRKIYFHYLKRATNDFVGDPLGTDIEMVHIKTAEELVQKINAQPYGYYILDNDIDFSNMTTNVTQTFMGKLDGNGHKITGNTIPIFQKIRFGYVKDLVIENSNISKTLTTVGALAAKTEYSVLEDIYAKDINLSVGGRNAASLIGGALSNVSYDGLKAEAYKNTISSLDDISKFTQDPGGIFVIENDIDFTGYTGTDSVVTVPFTGKIEGNGHTFKNLTNLSLFSNFNGTVENLNIKNFTNKGTGDEIAAFAKFTSNATLRNMKFENITLEGRNRVAPVTTFDNSNSTFERISVINANVKGSGVYVSTFIGRKYGGTIKNVYVNGSIECTTTENGGLIGALQKGGTIENVVTNVTVNKPSNTDGQNRQQNAGFIGNIYTDGGTLSIKNSISVSSMKGYTDDAGNEYKPYKFTGASEGIINGYLVNCYEYEEATGTSSVSENTSGHLESASKANVYDRRFYIDKLSFDEEYWDFDDLDQTGYPKLKVDGNVEVLTLD